MRTVLFLITISISQALAFNSYSQGTRLNLNMEDETILKVLERIEDQSDFYFMFDATVVDLNQKISINCNDLSVKEILDKILLDKGIAYTVVDRQIALTNVSSQSKMKQSQTVSGKVTDEAGIPLPGVTIVVKGTTTGIITDGDGAYTLPNVPGDAVLVFSFVGMKTLEVPVAGKSTIDMVMEEDAIGIGEVVAIGYGTQKSRDLIGSVSSVKSDEISSMNSLGVTEALQGRASGIQITTNSGALGSASKVRIRGTNSISSGKNPLWIIDGIPVYTGGGLEHSASAVSQDPLSMINPNDIESIEILKDAAATAIYGSRGSNGIILVTTKTGKNKKGEGSISVDYSTGVSNLVKDPEDIGYADTKQWLEVTDKALQVQTGNPDAKFDPQDALGKSPVGFSDLSRAEAEATNSNWFDQVLRQGSFHDFNITAAPGLEKGSAYISLNYRKDEGVIVNNSLERLSFRLNSEFSPIKNISVGNKLSFSYSDNNRTKSGAKGGIGEGGGSEGPWEAVLDKGIPWMPIYDENSATGYWSENAGNIAANNDPRFVKDNVKQYRLVGGLFAQYDVPFVEGLSVRSELGVDFIQNSSTDWKSKLITSDNKSYAYQQSVNRRTINYNAYATYNRTIEDHNFNVVLGTESMTMNQWRTAVEGRELVSKFQELGSNPLNKIFMYAAFAGEDYLRSYFGRANYKFKDKYLLGVSFRKDGSSKFGADYRWGDFTAYSAGWIVSEEEFFKPLADVISLLKLRGSYGQTGNNNIPANVSETLYSNSPNKRYGLDTDIPAGTTVSNIGAKTITWETTGNYDIGLDYGLLKNRINGSFAYYYRDISDMLLQVNLPLSTGVGGNSIWANVGDMSNQGFEFNVSSVNVQTKNFKWTTDFNVSTQKNKIKTLTKELDEGGKGIQYGSAGRAVTGKPIGTFYMADYAGIDPEKGVEMIWEIDIAKYDSTGVTEKTGRKIAATRENVMTHKYLFDKKNYLPSFFGGLNNTFTYKAFELNVFLTFSGGNYIFDDQFKRGTRVYGRGAPLLADVTPENIWSPTNTDAKYPIQAWEGKVPGAAWDWSATDPNTGELGWWDSNSEAYGNYAMNWTGHSRWLYKGDYVRVKTLRLTYNLPSHLVSKLGLKTMRVYAQGTNLFTFTKYPGYDPEVEGVTWSQNRVNSSIPNAKTISCGVSVKF